MIHRVHDDSFHDNERDDKKEAKVANVAQHKLKMAAPLGCLNKVGGFACGFGGSAENE